MRVLIPAVVLLAPEGLPGCVLEVADELSNRLGCPVFRIPEPEIVRRRRFWSGRRLAEVVGRSRIVQRSRDTWRGRRISSDS